MRAFVASSSPLWRSRVISVTTSPNVFMRRSLLAPSSLQQRTFGTDVIPIISKETLKKRLEDKHPFVWIDVREPHELMHGTMPGAINIPVKELPTAFGLRPGEFQRKYGVAKPSPDTEIVFSCRAGPRALNAAKMVNSMGYDKTICYQGSFLDWYPDRFYNV